MREGKIVNRTVNLIPFGFSIDENALSQGVKVYPNPSAGSVFIELDRIEDPNVELQINDVSGRLVFSQSMNVGNGKIAIEHNLPEGVYTISVSNGKLDYAPQKLSVVR